MQSLENMVNMIVSNFDGYSVVDYLDSSLII